MVRIGMLRQNRTTMAFAALQARRHRRMYGGRGVGGGAAWP